ncbi:MAG: DUF5667 domain-containing protein, partial [Anaerolineae bacterium]
MSLAGVLDDCLRDIEIRQATVEDCLDRHPHLREQLEPLLRLAQSLESAPDVRPSAAFKQATRERLLRLPRPVAAREAMEAPWARWRQQIELALGGLRWQPLLTRAVAALLVLLMIGGGTVYAAADSLPDSPLYPIKRATERTQLFLAPSLERRALLHLEFADKRLVEGIAMAQRGKDAKASQVLDEYGRELERALATIEKMATQGRSPAELSAQLREQLASQRQVLEASRDQLPAWAVEEALRATSRVEGELAELGAPSPATPTPSPTPWPTPTVTPVPGGPVVPTTPPAEPTATPLPPTPTPLLPTATPFIPTPTETIGPSTPGLKVVTDTPTPPSPTATETPLLPTATWTPPPPTATEIS